ncbi:uncharacterized protein LOC141917035 [Strix aluco]|uniref:uncharacterized protein LOC141917035 n=1 Tax=Strix aluco TaxID=111821 RepID=UPI003DA2C25F
MGKRWAPGGGEPAGSDITGGSRGDPDTRPAACCPGRPRSPPGRLGPSGGSQTPPPPDAWVPPEPLGGERSCPDARVPCGGRVGGGSPPRPRHPPEQRPRGYGKGDTGGRGRGRGAAPGHCGKRGFGEEGWGPPGGSRSEPRPPHTPGGPFGGRRGRVPLGGGDPRAPGGREGPPRSLGRGRSGGSGGRGGPGRDPPTPGQRAPGAPPAAWVPPGRLGSRLPAAPGADGCRPPARPEMEVRGHIIPPGTYSPAGAPTGRLQELRERQRGLRQALGLRLRELRRLCLQEAVSHP